MIHCLPQEAPVFLASKWLHLDLLVETSEFEQFFSSIDRPLFLFSTLGVQPKGKNRVGVSDFLSAWQRYIALLKQGLPVNDADFRFFFTLSCTFDLEAVRVLDLPNDREVIAPYAPLMQMQLHRFSYSMADNKFHSQAFGVHSVSWGVRLSYPQLYQYPNTRKVEDALDETKFVNATLFSKARSWMREVSTPTPFLVEGQRVNVPIRLGKSCFSWIDAHPDLAGKKLSVYKREQ